MRSSAEHHADVAGNPSAKPDICMVWESMTLYATVRYAQSTPETAPLVRNRSPDEVVARSM